MTTAKTAHAPSKDTSLAEAKGVAAAAVPAPDTQRPAADTRSHGAPAAEAHAAQEAVQQEQLRGYVPFLWHGLTLFRILDAPDRTFATEREAADFVTKMRLMQNLGHASY